MKKSIIYAALLPIVLSIPLHTQAASNVDERLQQLESALEEKSKQIEKLEKQAKRSKKIAKKTNSKIDDYFNKIKFNGFFTSGFATHNVKDKTYQGITEEVTWQPDTRLGLQMTANISERTSVTMQLVGKARDDRPFRTNMEWAFVSYKATDSLTLRAGRLRTPFYMLSEFFDVGFSYPWVRPPTEVYNIDTLKGFEGMDLIWNYSVGEWSGLLQVDIGSGVSETDPMEFDLIKAYGINNTLNYGNWSGRLSYRGAKVRFYSEDRPADDDADGDISNSELVHNHNPVKEAPVGDNLDLQPLAAAGLVLSDATEMPAFYYSLGGQYDDGSLFVLLEAVRLDWDFEDFTVKLPPAFAGLLGTSEFVLPPSSSYDAYYITTGYRIGKWTPYLMAAEIEHFSDASDKDRLVFDQIIAVASAQPPPSKAQDFRKSTSYTLGLNYNLTPNIKLKGAVQHFADLSGTVGNFGEHSGMEEKNVYTFLVDVLF